MCDCCTTIGITTPQSAWKQRRFFVDNLFMFGKTRIYSCMIHAGSECNLQLMSCKLATMACSHTLVGFGKLFPRNHLLFYSFTLRYWAHYSFKVAYYSQIILNSEHIVCSTCLIAWSIKMIWSYLSTRFGSCTTSSLTVVILN